MFISPRYLRVATVLTIALATGHVMQNADAIAARLGLAAPVPTPPLDPGPEEIAMTAAPEMAAPATGNRALFVASFDPSAVPRTRRMPQRLWIVPPEDAATETAAACEPRLALSLQPAATVRLTYEDACAADAPVSITHAGMTFTARTDAAGRLQADIPAMTQTATVRVETAPDRATEASVEVPTLAIYDRVAVVSNGAGLTLHAYEFGAAYGSDGHVWQGHPRDAGSALKPSGGYSVRLGDAGAAHAEVYTFPAGRAPRKGVIEISVEAEVTAANCGREVTGTAFETLAGTLSPASALRLSMPGCDAIGDSLVMGDLFADLEVAAN